MLQCLLDIYYSDRDLSNRALLGGSDILGIWYNVGNFTLDGRAPVAKFKTHFSDHGPTKRVTCANDI